MYSARTPQPGPHGPTPCMEPRSHPFFTGIQTSAAERLLAAARTRVLPPGTVLFNEGDPADCIYLMLDGEVELIKADVDTNGDHSGPTEVLARMKAGEYFGEVGVLDGHGRSTGAVSPGESRVLCIPGGPFMEVLNSESGTVCVHIFKRILGHLRSTNDRYIEAVLHKEKLQIVGEMAGTIIHDFKNPITGIQLAAELIGMKHGADAVTSKYCKLIAQQTERMVSMAQELLDYSKGGASSLDCKLVHISEFLASFESLNADYAARADCELHIEAADALVSIDAGRVMRVLQNLMTNAVEALDGRAGRVEIRTEKRDDGWLLVTLSDNGPGIPEKIRATLFEPFVTYGKRTGTGLGMAICKTIIEAHGGSITFETELGVGTTFLLWLPLAATGEGTVETPGIAPGSEAAP
ncbi:cyclic nucleotide-binding protein [Verrucomicrobia bacterium LW23]|nr:cyclic nucleotide-binding protein [Verrucomicrobia bacterium LW23]